ncbi:alpha-N-acetylneuraminate alpha-2,8-sialyltransferase ST8SIA3-like [Saccoglossus kowalevskii]|uniref:Sia-alpha-2,3-Gal-beta-1,4-GlcNAc-R:alpha 2,8-sialyltransferase-like n=1 Tax=Saccoglossus kowalevskii TaxID=10224 RepID=A0ABM0MK12_SACKO|nr:PREDICTED: sia-alpha-2,3-Gal-beta-1,4-GlcNAc-R:alpha 2,8-sialyltransferase-like [Saccoglossus kowalevskii]
MAAVTILSKYFTFVCFLGMVIVMTSLYFLNYNFAQCNCDQVPSDARIGKEKNLLRKLRAVIRDVKEWSFNKTNFHYLREKLQDFLKANDYPITENTADFLQMFVNNFRNNSNLYRRCSIVGNSGILKDSWCGEEIDKADYVFRSNLPYIRGFTNDAGKKTNFTSFNPSIIWRRYNYDILAFNETLNSFTGHVMFATITKSTPEFLNHVIHSTTLGAMVLDRKYLLSLQQFWNLDKKVSTGMLLFTLGLSVCEEIHLFGYWPFYTDEKGNDLPYHYTEDLNWSIISRTDHSMVSEFQKLREFHQDGVVKLHIGRCLPCLSNK